MTGLRLKGCTTCQSTKPKKSTQPKPPLHPITPENYQTPFVNHSTGLHHETPEVQRTRHHPLTITDHDCSKATLFFPCFQKQLQRKTWRHYMPNTCSCLRHATTESNFGPGPPVYGTIRTTNLCKQLGIKQKPPVQHTTPKQTDNPNDRTSGWNNI